MGNGNLGSVGSVGNLGIILKLTKLFKLPKLLNLPILSSPPIIPIILITPIKIIGRARYFRNPQSVVPVTSPEALPRDTSPAEAGAWGWVRLGIACKAGRCRGGE